MVRQRCARTGLQIEMMDIERAPIDFGQQEERSVIGPGRSMIAAGIDRDILVRARRQIEHPDIAGEGGHIALAFCALIGAFLAIGDAGAVRAPARLIGRYGGDHARHAAGDGDLVKLGQGTGGEIAGLGRRAARRAEQNALAVRRKV